jgi:hypothetical protein
MAIQFRLAAVSHFLSPLSMRCRKRFNITTARRRYARILLSIALIGVCVPCLALQEGPQPLPPWPFHSAGNRKSEIEDQFRLVFSQVSRALDAGNVDALERLASSLLLQQGPTPGGRVPIHDFHQAMEVYLDECPAVNGFRRPLDPVLAVVRAWQKKYPNSAPAVVAEGDLLLCHALAARGVTAIAEVSAAKLSVFEDYLLRARAVLMRNRAVGARDPIWYEKMVVIGQYSDMDRDAFVKLVDEGMNSYPFDFDLAEMGVIYMTPRWGGSHKQVAAYVEHVLGQTSPETTPFVASRIYYTLLRGGYYYAGNDVLYMLHTTSEQIEQAMAAFVARYPDAVNVDEQAVVACALADKPKLRSLLAEIGDSPLLYYWDEIGKGYYFSLCRQFAELDTTVQRADSKQAPDREAGAPAYAGAFARTPSKETPEEIISRINEIEACWESVSRSARFVQLGTRLWLPTNPDESPPTPEQLDDIRSASPAEQGDAMAWSEQTQLCSDPVANKGAGDAAVAAHLATRLAAVRLLSAGTPYGTVNRLLHADAIGLADQLRAYKHSSGQEGPGRN